VQWKFNVKPPPLYEDAAVMVPCLTKCPSEYKGEKDAFRQVARIKNGIGIEGGVDKYTGETLDAIAKRASLAAVAAGPGTYDPPRHRHAYRILAS